MSTTTGTAAIDTSTIAAYIATAKKVDPAQDIRACYELSERYVRQYLDRWDEIYRLYHGYVKTKQSGSNRQANFHFHKIFQQVEMECARFVSSYYSHDPFVTVKPINSSSVNPARAMEELMQYYYEHCPVFYLARLRQVKYTALYGCGYTMPTWKTITAKVKRQLPVTIHGYQIPGAYQTVEQEEVIYDGIWFEVYSPSDVFPYPGCIDHARMPWIILKEFMYADDLIDMAKAGIGGFDLSKVMKIPANGYGQNDRSWRSKAQAIGLTTSESDPYLIHLLHKFTRKRWQTLANNQEVIRDVPNPFEHGEIPLVMGVKTIDPESYYPIGSVKPLITAQKLFNIQMNTWVNATLQNVWPMWKYRSTVNPNSLVSYPNNRIQVQSMNDVEILKMPEMKQDVMVLKSFLDAHFEEVSGYYGSQKGHSDQQNTATSDTIFSQQGDKRIGYDTMTYEQLTLIQEARQTCKNIQQFMPEEMELRINGPGGPNFQSYGPADVRGEFDFMASGASTAYNRDIINQQLINFFDIANASQQLVRMPNGALIPAPVLDTYNALKQIYEGFNVKNLDKILYRPELFGIPINNDLLGQYGLPAIPGLENLSADPRTGGMARPGAMPTSMSGLGGRMPVSTNPAKMSGSPSSLKRPSKLKAAA